jgi:hypothetical protein
MDRLHIVLFDDCDSPKDFVLVAAKDDEDAKNKAIEKRGYKPNVIQTFLLTEIDGYKIELKK